jgi:hypothetical protein
MTKLKRSRCFLSLITFGLMLGLNAGWFAKGVEPNQNQMVEEPRRETEDYFAIYLTYDSIALEVALVNLQILLERSAENGVPTQEWANQNIGVDYNWWKREKEREKSYIIRILNERRRVEQADRMVTE